MPWSVRHGYNGDDDGDADRFIDIGELVGMRHVAEYESVFSNDEREPHDYRNFQLKLFRVIPVLPIVFAA